MTKERKGRAARLSLLPKRWRRNKMDLDWRNQMDRGRETK